jgi:hypothetical protein
MKEEALTPRPKGRGFCAEFSVKYVVHPRIDLDAVVSLAILGARPEEVFFVPAGAKELPAELQDARVVDHPLGEKGRLDPDGVRHAAALSLPEARSWSPELLAEVDEQDSTGQVRSPRFSLGAVLAAIKAAIGVESPDIDGETMDREVYRYFRPIVVGLNLLHQRREEARALLASARIVELEDGVRVAVLKGEQPTSVGMLLNEELGCSAQVYSEGHNLGVFRYPGRTAPDLRRLADKLPGWFIHPAGFLAAWGTKKSPATSPPPVGTPQNTDGLIQLLMEEFGARKVEKKMEVLSSFRQHIASLSRCCLVHHQHIDVYSIADLEAWKKIQGETHGFALFRLSDGRYGTFTEWADYTGHGCQCRSEILIFASREEAVRMGLTDEGRKALGLEG